MSYLGCDISLNHGAMVLIEGGVVQKVFLYSDTKKVVEAGRKLGYETYHVDTAGMKKKAGKDKKLFEALRLHRLKNIFALVVTTARPDYACIEDYAYGAKSASHLQIGEAGGAMRLVLMYREVPFRLHEPGSIKMYIAWDGAAQKDKIAASVQERWGVSFSPEVDPEGDLADAYGVARLLQDEVQLRAGIGALAGRHPKEIEVFNRVTKQNPVNLLARPFIRV